MRYLYEPCYDWLPRSFDVPAPCVAVFLGSGDFGRPDDVPIRDPRF